MTSPEPQYELHQNDEIDSTVLHTLYSSVSTSQSGSDMLSNCSEYNRCYVSQVTTKFPVPMQILSKNLESEEIEMEDDGWNDDSSANLNINAINLKEIALDQDLDLTVEELEQIKQ